jgi:hypothetical protein
MDIKGNGPSLFPLCQIKNIINAHNHERRISGYTIRPGVKLTKKIEQINLIVMGKNGVKPTQAIAQTKIPLSGH